MKNCQFFAFTFFISILVVFAAFQFKNNSDLNAVVSSQSGELASCKSAYRDAISVVEGILNFQWKLEGCRIKEGLMLQSLDSEIVLLDSLLDARSGKSLIVRFFDTACEDCQIQELEMIKRSNLEDRTIVIASFGTAENLRLYMESSKLTGFNVYQLLETDIAVSQWEYPINKVFCFVTDSSRVITNVHEGNYSFKGFSENYYDLLKNEVL
jgi:hypothetical protein